MDEPDLPPLSWPPRATGTQAHSRLAPPLTRKRTFSDHDDEPVASSDPALFSSDEAAPGAENYALSKRKKRTFRGSWWDRHPAEPGTRTGLREKRRFKRNFDSGIFMGSESEEPLSSDSITIEDEFLRDLREDKDKSKRAVTFTFGREESDHIQPRRKLASSAVVEISKEHEVVCEIIEHCLDHGKEDVDLTSMALSSLPADITSLNTLSKQDELAPGMLHIGTNLEPALRLFLGNNSFTRVPTPIFSLQNLRVLSLRNNNLTHIPSAIGELVNLKSLNIAGNQLSELPTEILDLVTDHDLEELTLYPNPWLSIDGVVNWPRDWIRAGGFALRKVHRSVTAKASHFPPDFPQVPTLTELALRQLSKYDPLGDIDFAAYMPPDAPETVVSQLRTLRQQPGRRCTACKTTIMLAREESLEYWIIRDDSPREYDGPIVPVPFRRLRCWECSKSSRLSDAGWDKVLPSPV